MPMLFGYGTLEKEKEKEKKNDKNKINFKKTCGNPIAILCY